MHTGFKEASRNTNWGVIHPDGTKAPMSGDDLKLGAILRIADAVEVMSSRYVVLLKESETMRKQLQISRDSIRRLHRRISAMAGVNTKLKKKLAAK